MAFMEQNSDDSSSEDEMMKEALKEATDSQFLTKSLFGAKEDDNTNEKAQQNTNQETGKKFDEFGVSEGFKDFMSKKLTQLLDRNIEMVEENKKRKKSGTKKVKSEDSGIKLLRTSLNVLPNVIQENNCETKPKRRLIDNSIAENNTSKCKEVAVDPDWILSKSETKFWSNKTKGVVFNYKKMTDGTLVEK